MAQDGASRGDAPGTDQIAPAPAEPSNRARWIAPLALLAAVGAFLVWWIGDPLLGETVVADPTNTQDTYLLMTLYEVWGGRLAGGELANWFPEYDGGYPAPAAWMYGLRYPGAALFALVSIEAAWSWTFLLHALFGALGAYAWTREERGGWAGPLAAGVVFGTAEFLLGRFLAGHQNLVWPVVWTPWIAWAAVRAVRGSTASSVLLGLVAAAGLLAGHVQVWFYLAPALLLHAASHAGRDRGAWGRLCLGAGVALAASAVQWLPTLEFQSVVGEPPERVESVYLASSAAWTDLVGRLLPGTVGGSLGEPSGPNDFRHELVGVAGLPVFAAAVLALFRADRTRVTWGALAVLGGVLALGSTASFPAQLNEIPPLAWMRAPARALVLWLPALAYLSGSAVGDWCDRESPPVPVLLQGLGLAVAAALAAMFQTSRFVEDASWTAAAFGVAAVLLLGVALWWNTQDDGRRLVVARAAPALLLLGFAVFSGPPPVTSSPSDTYRADWFERLPTGMRAHRVHVSGGPLPNVERLGGRTLRPLSHARTPWHESFRQEAKRERAYWLDVAGAFAPLDPARVRAGTARPTDLSLRTIATAGRGRVFDGAVASSDDDALAALDEGDLRLHLTDGGAAERASVLVEEGVVEFLPDLSRADELHYDVLTPVAARVLLTEIWHPGWVAEVDGEERPVRRGNVAFRVVDVPADRSRLVLRYEPWSAGVGLWVSVLAVAAGLVRLGLACVRRPRSDRVA